MAKRFGRMARRLSVRVTEKQHKEFLRLGGSMYVRDILRLAHKRRQFKREVGVKNLDKLINVHVSDEEHYAFLAMGGSQWLRRRLEIEAKQNERKQTDAGAQDGSESVTN